MFQQRRNRNMAEAAFATLALIYHMTVRNLRKEHRNAVAGLAMTIVQASAMVMAFYLMYRFLGVERSPLRGDFVIYIMSGIFMYLTHVQTAGAVSKAEGAVSGLMKHAPMNTAITISAAALAVLYRQTLASFVMLYLYHTLVTPFRLDQPLACYAMLLFAWFSGACVGLILAALRPWWPQGATVLTTIYMRANMVASGKMFVANALPGFLLPVFDWNPLFHIIDQTRGFAFINYAPHNSNLTYPLYCTVSLLMIGLMAEFVTRNNQSISWSAGR